MASSIIKAQTGVHIQERSGNRVWIHNKDSVYMSVGTKDFSRVCLVNPKTKEWKYLNTNQNDYHEYTGFFVMKNNLEGVMSYPYNPNKVYKTTDGWQTITVVANAPTLNQLVVTDAGYVGFNSTFKNLYFSPDGLTWNVVATGGSTDICELRSYKNKAILYTGNESGSFVSTDGGKNFSYVDIKMSFPGFGKGKLINFIMFSQDTLLAITADAKLYKTFDCGTTAWTSFSLPAVARIAIVKNINEIYAGDQVGKAYFTSDGGVSWQQKKGIAASTGFYIDSILYQWPVSVSSDNGDTWNDFLPIFSSNNFNDISFNGSKGILAAGNGAVNISLDKGRSFSSDIKLPTSQNINAVKVLDNGDLLAEDGSGKIFYSIDSGKNWTKNASGASGNGFRTSAEDSVILFGGFTQYPSISKDHGKTFTTIFVKGGTHTQTVMPNGTMLDAAAWFDYSTFTDKGWVISKWTIDGTQTILDSIAVLNESLADIHNAADNTGYLITIEKTTKQTRIYKTTSGWSLGSTKLVSTIDPVKPGITNYENNPFVNRKMRIQTFGKDTVILSGTGNTFYHISYDGGLSWNLDSIDVHSAYPKLYPNMRNSYFFNSKEFIFTLNNQGLYLNVNSSTGNITAINQLKQNQQSIPLHYELFQNYPNPFNPSTTIKYQIPNSGFVTLKVYDLLGREAATLVNEEQTAGEHSVQFSTNNNQQTTNHKRLSSGVYVYKLSVNGYSTAKKLLLLK